MKLLQPTLWGSYLQTCAHLKRPFQVFPYTTLNEKLQVQQNVALQSGQMPSLMTYAIGNGGHKAEILNGLAKMSPLDHQADHAALYNQIPFVLRAVNDDLDANTRNLYAMRKEVTIDGRNYYAYYSKRLNLTDVTPGLKRTIKTDDGWSTTDYLTSAANLNPVPPSTALEGAYSTSGEYLSASAIITVPFVKRDVDELKNVARIMYGDEEHAVISEIAFCTGVDRMVNISTPTGQVNWLEQIAVQIDTFAACYYQLVFESEGFNFSIEVGVSDPLLGEQQITTASVIGASGLTTLSV